ncbi:MAG: protein kinase, partial [Deltaproteobacteria bacterium]|nr:protein kinase [Deltaproteobacteria bacterium]
ILPQFSEDAEFIHMFIDEARLAGFLRHPGIVPIYEIGRCQSTLYLVMEYVWGRDLLQVLRTAKQSKGHIPYEVSAYIGAKLCEALHYAHTLRDEKGQALNIVHRDVSPQNVLISFDGRVKLIDFGIAKASFRITHTQVGTIKGKMGYMSPEQVRGLPLDGRSDLFAVGTLLYEMITLRPLFARGSDMEIIQRIRDAEVPPIESIAPRVPKKLAEIVMRALKREPADRFSSGEEMQQALLAFLSGFAPHFERPELARWLRQLFYKDFIREKARLDALDAIGRPVAYARELPTSRSTLLEIEPNEGFEPIDEREFTEVIELTSLLSRMDFPGPPSEVFFESSGGEPLNAYTSIEPPSSLHSAGVSTKTMAPHLPATTDPSHTLSSEPNNQKGERSTLRPQAGSFIRNTLERLAAKRLITTDPDPIQPDVDGRLSTFSIDPSRLNSRVIRRLLASHRQESSPPSPHPAPSQPSIPLRASRGDIVFFSLSSLLTLSLGGVTTTALLAMNQKATVELHCNPPVDALVVIDGRPRGKAPLRVSDLPSGHHTIVLVAPGYETTQREVFLHPREIALIEIALLPKAKDNQPPPPPQPSSATP